MINRSASIPQKREGPSSHRVSPFLWSARRHAVTPPRRPRGLGSSRPAGGVATERRRRGPFRLSVGPPRPLGGRPPSRPIRIIAGSVPGPPLAGLLGEFRRGFAWVGLSHRTIITPRSHGIAFPPPTARRLFCSEAGPLSGIPPREDFVCPEGACWERRPDSNRRPLGYEPSELPTAPPR